MKAIIVAAALLLSAGTAHADGVIPNGWPNYGASNGYDKIIEYIYVHDPYVLRAPDYGAEWVEPEVWFFCTDEAN